MVFRFGHKTDNPTPARQGATIGNLGEVVLSVSRKKLADRVHHQPYARVCPQGWIRRSSSRLGLTELGSALPSYMRDSFICLDYMMMMKAKHVRGVSTQMGRHEQPKVLSQHEGLIDRSYCCGKRATIGMRMMSQMGEITTKPTT